MKRGQCKPTKVGRIKMIVIDDLKADTIDPIASQSITTESTIVTDDSSSYTNFHKIFKEHHSQVIPKERIGKVLLWVHIAISNAKRTILDIFHDVKPEYLQSYLNEFCYKFNRRHCDFFDRLMFAAVSYQNDFVHRTYRETILKKC